ncbi:uncharacterized protein DS421_3g82670 [Arachis hypogaea]|nr:uncharacterized protein DS421_3g82670 [Arachis hypogaea]
MVVAALRRGSSLLLPSFLVSFLLLPSSSFLLLPFSPASFLLLFSTLCLVVVASLFLWCLVVAVYLHG